MELAAYLARIDLPSAATARLDVAGLRAVAAAHAASVPFENTRAHHGERISVRLEDILERLVERRGGGVCYELNGGLGWLLEQLGAEVEINAAQVLPDPPAADASGGAGASGGLPMSHHTLVVTLPDGDRHLVDVGFGGEMIVRDVPADGEIVQTARGSAYRIDRRPRQLSDFEALAWWHSTSPGSRFMRSIIVSSTRSDGIASLFGRDVDGQSIAWYSRGVDEAQAREVTAESAQEIAAEVFGLTSPLPQRIVQYVPAN